MFEKATHTVIVSDIHMSEAEPSHPGNPLWKRYKRRRFFVDRSFRRFLEKLQVEINGDIELILNGDIFDFDSVMSFPEQRTFKVNWLEKRRGLAPEEAKSTFKMDQILKDHYIWVEALADFVRAGNRVVFVIGNHDAELHWPGVQGKILEHLKLEKGLQERVRFCEFFYVSNQDTLIEHGNQYDAYCLTQDPVHPTVRKHGKTIIRLPFGNLAGKFMINGMGLFNPHVETSYIKSSLWEYIVFFTKHVMRTEPFLMITWFWSAMVTLVVALEEGFLPALRDPLTIEARVEDIAKRANSQPRVVRALRALHVHPAVHNPLKILRELWLDRFMLLAVIFFAAFQIFSVTNLVANVSAWWFAIPFVLLMPILVMYARSVESDIFVIQKAMRRYVPLSSRLAEKKRVIHGHTHRAVHTYYEGVEYLNTGTWSPAFHDVECTKPFGRKCFAWIKPEGSERKAELFEWDDPEWKVIGPLGERT